MLHGTGDPVTKSAGLPGFATALDCGPDIKVAGGIRNDEGRDDVLAMEYPWEVVN